jgi:hypothetical protein
MSAPADAETLARDIRLYVFGEAAATRQVRKRHRSLAR